MMRKHDQKNDQERATTTMRRHVTRLGAKVLLPCLLALAGSSCHSFKYFDVHVRFDGGTFDITTADPVQVVRVVVSGADSASFKLSADALPSRRPMTTDRLDSGVFEFSTFAESGQLTFTATAYDMLDESDACKRGEGSVMVPVTAQMTTMADLKIVKTGSGCAPASQ